MSAARSPVVLDLDLPSGGRVRTAWTPPVGEGLGWAWVQHGFLRRAAHMEGLAELLSRAGLAVVRPDIPSLRRRRSMHDATWLTEVALTVGRAVEAGIPQSRGVSACGPWALAGHSAGAAIAVHAASCLSARHGAMPVAALVLLDPVDTVGGLLAAVLRAEAPSPLGGVVRVHACRPSRCNRHGATVRDLAGRGWPVTHHPGLAHPDPERIPGDCRAASVPGPDPWLARVCGPPGRAADIARLAEEVRAQMTPRGDVDM